MQVPLLKMKVRVNVNHVYLVPLHHLVQRVAIHAHLVELQRALVCPFVMFALPVHTVDGELQSVWIVTEATIALVELTEFHVLPDGVGKSLVDMNPA